MSTNLGNDSIEVLCHQCGQTFSTFLHEMADNNAKVVCPNCREGGDCNPPKTVPGRAERPVRKII
jgi:hypothetical protein